MADDIDVAELEAWAAGLAEIHARIAPRGRPVRAAGAGGRLPARAAGTLGAQERLDAGGAGRGGQPGRHAAAVGQRGLGRRRGPGGPARVRGRAPGGSGRGAGGRRDRVSQEGEPVRGGARQYSGTAGRIENCQIGVFLGYATPAGRTLVDRELYLPQAWVDDPDRCAQAGVPAAVGFATKPELAIRMLTRALDAGVPAGWVTADEVYGQHGGLRAFLEQRRMPHVLAIPTNQRLWADTDHGPAQLRADRLAAALPAQAWKRISAGAGAKGPRVYWWARTPIRPLHDAGDGCWLLVRRSLTDPDDLAYYACHGPAGTPLRELARIAGTRWAIEECFQSAKGETGLDQYQVRRYDSWYRHITLAMFAHAFLTVTRAAAAKKGHTVPPAS